MSSDHWYKWLLSLLTAGLILYYQAPLTVSTPSPIAQDNNYYNVTKVADGDTFSVSINNKTEKVRLIGIDTPETVDPRKPVQCFGKEASNKAKELLKDKKVRLESDPASGNKDRYGRLLRYAFLEDGQFVNELMISQGYAHEYTYNLQNYKYQTEFKRTETEAREAGRGLWAETTLASCDGVK